MEQELNTEFDLIVLGTGLTESLITAAGARVGKKVLHIDRNPYYGGHWASFSLKGLEEWVSSSKSQSIIDVHPDLEERESMLNLSNPNSVYSGIKNHYHVPDTIASSVADAVSESQNSEEGPRHEELNSEEDTKNQEKKKLWSMEELRGNSRKFNIDLAPKLLFSRGSMVELLISSNVARYLEFKCLTKILTLMSQENGEDELVVVPCSRSDVFTTDVVNLIEKRLLMKFLKFCHQYENQRDRWQDFADKPFREFLSSHEKLTATLIHFVTNSIAMVGSNATCQEGLAKTSLFLQSLGRYGVLPFLFSIYGSGEMPQAFCRLCAVFEGVYMLRKEVEAIVMNESSNEVKFVLTEGERFKCKNLVMDIGYLPTDLIVTDKKSCISRGVFVTNRSILPCDKDNLSLLRIPGEGRAVTVIELGSATGVCPKDTCLVHLTCIGEDAENDLRSTVERLFSHENESKPKILHSFYFNRNVFEKLNTENFPTNLHVCSGPDVELDYDFAVQQARSIFTSIYPEEEFLPRAPDPEEIVFEGEAPREGDNFASDESEDGSSKVQKEAHSEIQQETPFEVQMKTSDVHKETSSKVQEDVPSEVQMETPFEVQMETSDVHKETSSKVQEDIPSEVQMETSDVHKKTASKVQEDVPSEVQMKTSDVHKEPSYKIQGEEAPSKVLE